jgi:hypothetical protein
MAGPRFEAFSQSCGVYARADLLPDRRSLETRGKGATNVDFNAPMRAALAQARDPESLDLRATPERVVVGTSRGTIVERKVKLPMRWLKGFAEVQALGNDPRACGNPPRAGSAPVSIGHPTRSEGPRSGLAAAATGGAPANGRGRMRSPQPASAAYKR